MNRINKPFQSLAGGIQCLIKDKSQMVSNLNPTKSCPQEARLHVVEMGARRLSGTIEALRQRDATCLVPICLAFVFVFVFV